MPLHSHSIKSYLLPYCYTSIIKALNVYRIIQSKMGNKKKRKLKDTKHNMYDNYDNKIKYNCINILQILSPTKHKLKGLHSFMSSFSTPPHFPLLANCIILSTTGTSMCIKRYNHCVHQYLIKDNVETSSRIACAEQCHSSKSMLELDTKTFSTIRV